MHCWGVVGQFLQLKPLLLFVENFFPEQESSLEQSCQFRVVFGIFVASFGLL